MAEERMKSGFPNSGVLGALMGSENGLSHTMKQISCIDKPKNQINMKSGN